MIGPKLGNFVNFENLAFVEFEDDSFEGNSGDLEWPFWRNGQKY